MGILIQSKTICSELLVSLLSPLMLLLGEDILVATATMGTAAQAMVATEENISVRTMVLPLTPLALLATLSLPPVVPSSALRIDSVASVLVQDSDLSALAPEAELVASNRELAAPPQLASASITDLSSTRDLISTLLMARELLRHLLYVMVAPRSNRPTMLLATLLAVSPLSTLFRDPDPTSASVPLVNTLASLLLLTPSNASPPETMSALRSTEFVSTPSPLSTFPTKNGEKQ